MTGLMGLIHLDNQLAPGDLGAVLDIIIESLGLGFIFGIDRVLIINLDAITCRLDQAYLAVIHVNFNCCYCWEIV